MPHDRSHPRIGRVDVDLWRLQCRAGGCQRRRRRTVEGQGLSERDHLVPRSPQFVGAQIERIERRQFDAPDAGRNGCRHVS
jgi:hypothetical protein